MMIEEARERAAQAWCRPATKQTVMDPVLAEEFARIIVEETNPTATDKFVGHCSAIGKMMLETPGLKEHCQRRISAFAHAYVSSPALTGDMADDMADCILKLMFE